MTPNIQSRKRKPKSRRVHSHIAATIPTPSPVPAIDSDRLPWTPVHKSSANFEEFDPSRMHPINDPDIEHSLQDNSDQESGIVCEGAMVIDEAFGYKYYQVKRVYKPGIGTFPGNIFRTIKVGLEEEGGDVSIPTFDPKVFHSAWSLRRRAGGLEEPTGITHEELKQLCVQCKDCGNFVTQTSHPWHKCANHTVGAVNPTATTVADDDFFQSSEYCLDAVGSSVASLGGITKEELESLFTQCLRCGRLLTAAGRHRHSS